MTDLASQTVLITGASSGIGLAIAHALAARGSTLVLFARNESRLSELSAELKGKYTDQLKVHCRGVDVQDSEAVSKAVNEVVEECGRIDVLVNNAGLALGTPSPFPDLKLDDIRQMSHTNIDGLMYTTHAVLNTPSFSSSSPRTSGQGRSQNRRGTILNITSTTALEAPPFPGEAVYHASKAFQEAFTNALRNELVGTDIRVLALRPGIVATHFHRQRVGYDDDLYAEFMKGIEPLVADEVAKQAVYMLEQPVGISLKALDVVCTAQRSLPVIDREWNNRKGSRE